MDIRLRDIRGKQEMDIIKRIYTSSFPKNERAPFHMLKSRAARNKAEFLAICDGGKVVGTAYVVSFKDMAYLFYLAIDSGSRGQGFGTRAVEMLLRRYRDKRFFLALEQLDETADNYADRVKRHEFYRSCGLVDLPFKIKEADVIFASMGAKLHDSSAFTVTPEEYKELMRRYTGFLMFRIIDLRLIPLNNNTNAMSGI